MRTNDVWDDPFQSESTFRYRTRTYLHELSWPSSLLAHLLGAPKTSLPKILVNGFPKAGTHLLQHCVSLLPLRHRRLPSPRQPFPESGKPPSPDYLAKLDWMLSRMDPGEYVLLHLFYHPSIEARLQEHGVRMVSIMRDPRDVVVARVLGRPPSAQAPYAGFDGVLRSQNERLTACILTGLGENRRPPWDIGHKVRAFLPWEGSPLNLPVRFETLIGPRGGGDAAQQEAAVARIARHLGLDLSPEKVRAVAAGTFWERSYTFRRGRSGDWKEFFTPEHKAVFKKVAGPVLIEMGYEKDASW